MLVNELAKVGELTQTCQQYVLCAADHCAVQFVQNCSYSELNVMKHLKAFHDENLQRDVKSVHFKFKKALFSEPVTYKEQPKQLMSVLKQSQFPIYQSSLVTRTNFCPFTAVCAGKDWRDAETFNQIGVVITMQDEFVTVVWLNQIGSELDLMH